MSRPTPTRRQIVERLRERLNADPAPVHMVMPAEFVRVLIADAPAGVTPADAPPVSKPPKPRQRKSATKPAEPLPTNEPHAELH